MNAFGGGNVTNLSESFFYQLSVCMKAKETCIQSISTYTVYQDLYLGLLFHMNRRIACSLNQPLFIMFN